MRRLAFLLRPGWLALAVVVIAFTYLCFTVLAPWQLGKNTKTSRENDQIQHSLTADPVPLTTLLPQQDSSAPDAQWRRVTATGHYLPDKQVVARLRVAEGDHAMEVLLPFAVDGGPTVLVDRGYVRPLPGSRVPPIRRRRRRGTVTITARLRDSERSGAGQETVPSATVCGRCIRSAPSQIATLIGSAADRARTCSWSTTNPAGSASSACPTWTRARSCPTASSGSRSASSRRFCWATSSYAEVQAAPRREGARPPAAADRKPAPADRSRTSSPTATAGGADARPRPPSPPRPAPRRDSRTARRTSATAGGRPSPSAGRICSS